MGEKRAIEVLLLGIMSLSCATVVNGRTQLVTVSSDPAGAQAVIYPDGIRVETPADVRLSRGTTHTIVLFKDGYESQTAQVVKRRSGWVWWNILFGGVIGVVVDYLTGGAYELSPTEVDTVLRPRESSE